MSYLDAATRRNQGAGQVNVLSENWKPVAIPKTLTKHKPLSHVIPGATSSAPASPPSARASDLQVSVIHYGSFNDLDPACKYYKSDSEVAKGFDQESVEAEFSRQSKPVGISRNEEERVKKFTRLRDDGDIKRENLVSELNASKNSLKEFLEILKDRLKDEPCLVIRQVFSEFRESKEGRSVDDRMKKVHINLLEEKGEMIVESMSNLKFTRVLMLMIFQSEFTNLKAHFSDPEWRETRRFPKFEDETVDYHWWKKNFDPDVVQTRLEIIKRVTKEVDPHLEYFSICQIVSCLNSIFHPSVDFKTVNEMAERIEFVYEGADLGPAILFMMPVVPRNKKI